MEFNITYRKKDKGWQYIINAKENGKWKYKGSKQGFATKALAKLTAEPHVDQLKEKEEAQVEALPEHKGLTFKYLADAYKKHRLLHNAFNTVSHFTSATKQFSTLNDKAAEDITTLDIQNCVDEMIRKDLSVATVKLYTHDIKMLFDFIINPYKIIKENPVTNDIRIPKREKQVKIKALNKAELEKLLSNIPLPKHHIASLLASKCGLRMGELIGLTWDRVDVKKMQITIDRQWKEIKPGKWGFGAPKSDNSYRTIPAPAVVISDLTKFKSQYPVHISNRILPYATVQSLSSTLTPLYKSIGFDITPHDLRHTYATTLIANGMDFKTVAKLMGHDVEETIKTYSHVTSDMMEKATNLINSIF